MAATNNTATPPQGGCINCFLDRHPGAPSNIIYVQNSGSYDTVYGSNIQNIRFLVSSTTTKPLVVVTPTAESHVQTSVICGRAAGLGVRARSGGHVRLPRPTVRHRRPSQPPVGGRRYQGRRGVGRRRCHAGRGLLQRQQGQPHGRFPCRHLPHGWPRRAHHRRRDRHHYEEVRHRRGQRARRPRGGRPGQAARQDGHGGGPLLGAQGRRRRQLRHRRRLQAEAGLRASQGHTVCTVSKTLNQNATGLLHRWQSVADKFDDNLYIRTLAKAIDDKAAPGDRNIQVHFDSLFLGTLEQLLPLMQQSFPELGLQASDCTEMTWLESVLYFARFMGRAPEVLVDRRPVFNSSFKAKSDFVREPISVAGWESIWDFLKAAKGEPLVMVMEPLGGVMGRIPESAIAFPHRKGNLFYIQYFMRWFETDAAVTQRHLDWMKKLHGFMTPYVSKNPRAAYLNFKDIDLGRSTEGAEAFAAAIGSWGRQYFLGNFRRLASVKGRVDGDNFFKNEPSIPSLVYYT